MGHHPIVWPRRQFFYAIGNTPAICLAQDLSLEEPARVLSLGCGDPRNILFTLHTLDSPLVPARPWDFTCCDTEPAILARNILLFSLIVEDAPLEKIFPIFFHFKIEESVLKLLLNQCKKLISTSSTISSWRTGPYGKLIRMCTVDSLIEIRRIWTLWAETENYTPQEAKILQAKFQALSKSVLDKFGSKNLTAFRSAGPLFSHSIKIAPKHNTRYWKKGLTSADPDDPPDAPLINPTFAFANAGEDHLTLHYGTDPLLPFHSASAFTSIKVSSSSLRKPRIGDLVRVAQEEFYSWCRSFKAIVQRSPGPITIRVFVGEALGFSRALHYRSLTNSITSDAYNSWWGGKRIVLDGGDYDQNSSAPAPLSFNVIETSNLVDALGLLNILISTLPLLTRTATSTLLTDALLATSEDPTVQFVDRICAELPLISLLLGLTPSTFVSGFSSVSNVHEILSTRLFTDKPQHHDRFTWKFPYLGDVVASALENEINRPLVFQPKHLAMCLFKIYLKMFAQEDLRTAMELQHKPRPSLAERVRFANNFDAIHYTRSTFAAFLKIVKDRTSTDWTAVMEEFHQLVNDDNSLMLGSNNYQDMCCQLHIKGVHTIDTMGPLRPAHPIGRLIAWQTIPAAVCVVIIVPREKLRPLERLEYDRIGTPVVHCEVRGPTLHNFFSDIRCIFGRLEISGPKSAPIGTIFEDSQAWRGNSPLIVSFWMPSWILVTQPEGLEARFSVRTTPGSLHLASVLHQPDLNIYEAKLTDEDHVHVLRARTNYPDELSKTRASYDTDFSVDFDPAVDAAVVNLDKNWNNVDTLMVRTDIMNETAKQILKSGAVVNVEQASPCAMKLFFDGFEKVVAFPFPIDGARNRVRIARKSSYIEILVPVSSGPQLSGGYSLNQFPVIPTRFGLAVWNIHRLDLDKLPALDLSQPKLVEPWLTPHIQFSFSDRERELRNQSMKEGTVPKDTLVEVKDSLLSMFACTTGAKAGVSTRKFGLSNEGKGGVYTLIFVTDLRLDLGAHTVVMDCCILPLTVDLVTKLAPLIGKMQEGTVIVSTGDEEIKPWKRLIPAVVERCRTWSHKPSCEYVKQGKIPLTLEYAESPICSCGAGIGVDEFKKVKEWKGLEKYVTRAAIGPLFALSYLDPVAGEKRIGASMETKEGMKNKANCAACGKSPSQAKLSLCSRCESIRYCSHECQKADWKRHKGECVKTAKKP